MVFITKGKDKRTTHTKANDSQVDFTFIVCRMSCYVCCEISVFIRYPISKYNKHVTSNTYHAEGGCERASDRSLKERGVSCTLSICDTFERMFVVIERNRNRQPDMNSTEMKISI